MVLPSRNAPSPSAPNMLTAPRLFRTVLLQGSIALLAIAGSGCASWTPVEHYERWSLYVRDGSSVDPTEFQGVFSPAFEAVEQVFGPFEEHVRVHAWRGSVQMESGRKGSITNDENAVQDVPGIGPARVQAFHARGGHALMGPSGVFVGTADPGTAVHELVHARLFETDLSLPLWLEEGIATFLGDGMIFEGRWVPDGLACWPLRELREETLSRSEIARLLEIGPRDDYSVRENVLVHFVGWAIVFDLYREDRSLDWRSWVERYSQGMDLDEAHERLSRTLDEETGKDWMERLSDPDPGVRAATAKGLWKLRDRLALEQLVRAFEAEEHPEVRVALAVNALASVSEVSLNRRLRRSLWRNSLRILRSAELHSEEEQEAARRLYQAYRYGMRSSTANEALQGLRRFWGE